jgi:hypothetical protein
VDGYFGFYWGKTILEYAQGPGGFPEDATRTWLEYFRRTALDIRRPSHKSLR